MIIKHLARAAGLAVAIVGLPAIAQMAIQPGTIVGTFSADGYLSSTNIFTVPADRNARITDIRLLYMGVTPCFLYVELGPTTRAYYGLTTQYQSISDHMVSGYGMVADQIVKGGGGSSCAGGNVYIQIRGFYFTIP